MSKGSFAAPALQRALQQARHRHTDDGIDDASLLRDEITRQIQSAASARIDYVEIVSTETFEPLERIEPGHTLIAVAAFFGATRLIDNMRI